MYLDCLIHGKKPAVDLRTPRINFMDQGKLCEIVVADLVKKGDDDPVNWVFGNLPWKTRVEVVFFVQIEQPIFTMPRASGVRSEGAPTIASSQNAPLGVPGEVPGGSSARMKASSGISSEAAKGSFDDASVSLGRIDGIMKTVCGEIERVPTTVERLSRVDGILPPDSGFDAESSKDDLSIEAKILVEIRQSVVHLRTSFGMFKQLQDAHCKPFEDEARVVISQIERSGDVDKGHGRGNEDRFGELTIFSYYPWTSDNLFSMFFVWCLQAIDDGGRDDNIFAENASAPFEEPAPPSDSFVAGVDDIVAKAKNLSGQFDRRVRKFFNATSPESMDAHEFVIFPTFDPPATPVHMGGVGHWVSVFLDLKNERFQLLDTYYGPIDELAVRLFWKITDNIKKLWSDASNDRETPLNPLSLTTSPWIGLMSRNSITIQAAEISFDSDFEKIVGMRKSGKSVGATVARRGGKNGVIARRKSALESGNITSSKRARRLPLKWRSPVSPLKKYTFPYLHEALHHIALPGDNMMDLTGRVLRSLFGEGRQMEGDVMDLLINQWKDIPETLEIFSCADRAVLSPYFIQFGRFVGFLQEVYGKAEYKANN
ncbi:hypothetical protein D1007_28840 [Hordeum vulgare]|nr:hypothetical protein D1007_28840 [Hordeum vulgare]